MTPFKKRGFTLIELLVVISIIGLLSSAILASLSASRAKARDAQRLSAMHQMQLALELYYDSNGRYPDSDYAGTGTWDTPGNGTFITPLVSGGFLPQHFLDPTTNNANGNYRYYRYGAGNNGCTKAFYVLGVVDMETSGRTPPHPSSLGWKCPSRDWQPEFDWVVGKFEQ